MNPNTPVPTFFYKKDILFLCCILALAVLLGSFFFFGKSGGRATVRINGAVVQTLPLNINKEYSFQNNGYTLTVQVKEGKVGIVSPSCADKLCQKAGFLEKEGATAVCLPANLSVTVEGASGADAITY